MTTYINATHGTLSGANKPLCFDEITAKQYGANSTKAQSKTVERELKALHKAGLLEFTPGRGGVPYYRLTTPAVPTEPQPSATAVAVHAAIEGGTDPAPGIAEQLRQAHAERLAMSQTIISICCAIGRDPGQTTTAELQQAVKDAITEARNSAAYETEKALMELSRERFAMTMIRKTLAPITAELFEGDAYTCTESEAIRTMSQLIDAQHELMLDQGQRIADQERETTELRAQIEAQILAGHNSASSANRLLTEVHEVLSTAWPEGWLQPGARTTLQLAQALKIDFGVLYGEHLDKQAAAPDAYLVTRYVRAGHGKTRAHPGGPTRHKKLDTATRKARAAIRGGYVRAEIHATNLVAVATFGAEIKPV